MSDLLPKKGDWVFDGCDRIGRVKNDPYDVSGVLHIDIVIYDRNGERLGRTSPRMGGPAGFEPACTASEWRVINKPRFPLPRYEYLKNLLTVVGGRCNGQP